jgi:outer membrane protein insertion porin family
VYLKNFFEDIKIERKNNKIEISVLEKPIIDSIQIKGNYFFDDKFYKNIIPLKRKERLNILKLKKSLNLIKETLAERGFNDFTVNYQKECKEQKCQISFIVNEGKPQIIREIKITGDFDEQIHSFLDINEGDPFDKVKLKQFIDRVKKYYEKKKLIGTELSYTFEQNELVINIIRGKAVEIELLGVEELKKKDILEIIYAHFQDKLDENVIKDSVNSLIFFYQTNGFVDVKIYSLIEKEDFAYKISYVINEGKRRIIDEIKLNCSKDD